MTVFQPLEKSGGRSSNAWKPYPAYKPSGVEWLGDVPEEWEVRRLKDCGRLTSGTGFPHEYQGVEGAELPFYKVGDLAGAEDGRTMRDSVNTITRETATELRAKIIPKGAIVYAKVGAALMLNRRRVTSRHCCIDNNMTAYVPRVSGLACDWAFYWTGILDFAEYANPGAVPSISEGDQSTLPIFLPPLPEQRAIADFLDRETGKIDRLVAKKRELIEKLKEQRAALISRAVTRGLNPDAKLKPSGVEWLGDVPEGWEVMAARYGFDIQLGKMLQPEASSVNDIELPYLKAQHVQWETVRTGDLPTMWGSKEDAAKYGVRDGDLLVCEGGDVGRAGIVKNPPAGTIIQNALHRVRPKEKNDVRILMYVLEHAASQGWFEILCNRATIAHFTGEKFGAHLVPLPFDPSEQRAIADFLDRETGKIDRLVEKVEEAIACLQEYRAALITAAVTGKIDVRGEALECSMAETNDQSYSAGDGGRGSQKRNYSC